jgi:hypothetical protein
MMDKVGKKQQQRYLTFPVTVAPKPTGKKRKKETKLSPKVKAGSQLVATNIQLLEHFPYRRNYTYGRDRSNDPKKKDFPVQTSHVVFFSSI